MSIQGKTFETFSRNLGCSLESVKQKKLAFTAEILCNDDTSTNNRGVVAGWVSSGVRCLRPRFDSTSRL